MKEESFTIKSSDEMEIVGYQWQAEKGKPKAIIQIAHGSAEHASRYKGFAGRLTENGFVVYANDHRGHGKTAGNVDNLSYFSDEDNGWHLAVEDMFRLTQKARKEYSGLPVFLLGHSMGSLLSREYILHYGKDLQGVILSGTAGGLVLLIKVLKFFSKRMMKSKGRKTNSLFLHNILFNSLSKKINPRKTDYDWLSRDEREVQKYIDDPYCGRTVTPEYAYQLACGADKLLKPDSYFGVHKELPMLILSGDNDPVGGKKGKDVKKVCQLYKKAGVKDVTLKLYPEARHEIFNEINREEVYEDVISWINQRM
ncbi:lysophospholipase [bacterium]|nr:lysophospholipase [bacterium]